MSVQKPDLYIEMYCAVGDKPQPESIYKTRVRETDTDWVDEKGRHYLKRPPTHIVNDDTDPYVGVCILDKNQSYRLYPLDCEVAQQWFALQEIYHQTNILRSKVQGMVIDQVRLMNIEQLHELVTVLSEKRFKIDNDKLIEYQNQHRK